MKSHFINVEFNQAHSSESPLSTIQVLALLSLPNVGKKKVIDLIQKNTSVLTQAPELANVLTENYQLNITRNQVEQALEKAELVLEEHQNRNIQVISFSDPQFPEPLRQIKNPPIVLYVKGDSGCLIPEYSVAVIGTRSPTKYASGRAFRLGEVFGEQGLVVVSGLAKGCDRQAHEGCLSVNGKTIAVLAHGLDQVYPKEHKKLADQIVEQGGCLVSEHQLGVTPRKNFFVERNRIQSGLSSAVVIVETDIKGGTMHTARFCLDQSRILACIDHKPENESNKSRGNKQLLREEKALPLRSPEQLNNFIQLISSKVPYHEPDESLISEPNSREETVESESLPNQDQSESNVVEAVQPTLIPESPDFHSIKEKTDQDNWILTRNELAQRLNVKPNTVTRNKSKGNEHFQQWSSKKDPQQLTWFYDERFKKYTVYFNNSNK